MADTRLSDLASASALSASDLFYVVQSAGSGGEKATGTQLLTLVGTTYVPLTGGTMTGALTIASGTLAASAPALNIAQTWNNAGVLFSALTMAITSSAAAAGSLLANMTVGGASKFSIDSNGTVGGLNFCDNTGRVAVGGTYDVRLGSTSNLVWTSGTYLAAADIILYRDAAATLAQRNGTTAQTLRVYGTYTDSSNYERLTLSTTAGTSVNIAAETLGTGADNLDLILTSAGTGSYKFGTVASFSSTGYLISPGVLLSTIFSVNYFSSTIRIGGSADLGWSSTASVASVPDVALRRSAAGVLDVDSGTAGTYRDLKLRNLLNIEYHQMTEMTAPSAPATNSVRIYAEDNGAGKTRLMALFATGAAQQIAIEP